MTNIITHVTNESGDYEALYLNGALILQQTHIPRSELKDLMEQNQPYTVQNIEVTEEWIDDEGGLYPNTVAEIPLEVYTS